MLSNHGFEDVPLLERSTLGVRAYNEIRKLLMTGRLAPAQRLSLRSLARALGVSVMPVRDAVNRLIAEHALATAPNRAIRVPLMTAGDFRELVIIRAEIEGFAAELAARHRRDEDLERIAEAEAAFRAESLSSTPDLGKAVALNMAFHFGVYHASGLPRLVEIIESLWLRVGPIINLETRDNPERLATGGAYLRHGEALAAIRRRDGTAARRAIADDIEAAAAFILARGELAEAE